VSLFDVIKIRLTARYQTLGMTGEEQSLSSEGIRLSDLLALLHLLLLEGRTETSCIMCFSWDIFCF